MYVYKLQWSKMRAFNGDLRTEIDKSVFECIRDLETEIKRLRD